MSLPADSDGAEQLLFCQTIFYETKMATNCSIESTMPSSSDVSQLNTGTDPALWASRRLDNVPGGPEFVTGLRYNEFNEFFVFFDNIQLIYL